MQSKCDFVASISQADNLTLNSADQSNHVANSTFTSSAPFIDHVTHDFLKTLDQISETSTLSVPDNHTTVETSTTPEEYRRTKEGRKKLYSFLAYFAVVFVILICVVRLDTEII